MLDRRAVENAIIARGRDIGLSAMLAVQFFALFIAAPLAATGSPGDAFSCRPAGPGLCPAGDAGIAEPGDEDDLDRGRDRRSRQRSF